jgi:hypothetical protein
LILAMTPLSDIGVLYGIEISATVFGRVLFGALYGFVGVCPAVPLAFAVNLTRYWR